MSKKDLDNFDIQYIDFYSELPSLAHRDRIDEKQDYIDSINNDITDLHDSPDVVASQGLSDKQVSQLAQDQYREASLPDHSLQQDVTLFSDNR